MDPCGAEIRISVAKGTVGNYITGNISSFLWLRSTGMTLSVCQTAVALGICPKKSLKLYLTLQQEIPNTLLGTFIKQTDITHI